MYQHLLHMVPGLKARIMEGSEEGTCHIAELVHRFQISYISLVLIVIRFRRVLPVHDQMTQKASKRLFSTGLHQGASH